MRHTVFRCVMTTTGPSQPAIVRQMRFLFFFFLKITDFHGLNADADAERRRRCQENGAVVITEKVSDSYATSSSSLSPRLILLTPQPLTGVSGLIYGTTQYRDVIRRNRVKTRQKLGKPPQYPHPEFCCSEARNWENGAGVEREQQELV